MGNMKVLLLTTHLNTGGIGVYTVNLARHLKKEGVDVTVASSGGDLEDILTRCGVPQIKMDIKTKSEFGVRVWRGLPALINLIRDGKFQLIHAQTRVTQVLAHITQKVTGVPFVATCHGFFSHRRLARRFFPCWGEKTIAISKSVRGHLIEDFHLSSDRIALIYNGIELERYLSVGYVKNYGLMQNIGLDKDVVVVGAIGRLSPVKGFKYLISAFKDIVCRDTEARLLIVGEGPEKDTLHKQVRRLGIADRVLLTSGDRFLERYLSVLDIFCLPSVSEGLGLSLMEAMAAGRACIVSDVGGLAELITHEENGILVPPGDIKALNTAILRLIRDARFRQRLGDNARREAADKFSIKDTVLRTIEVYREVIERREG